MNADSSLDDLLKAVDSLEDYETASAALMEIAHRAPLLGAQLALRILEEIKGDAYLRAFAFNILHSADRVRSLKYVNENMLSAEPLVFAAMLSEVAEDVGLLNDSDELRMTVVALADTLQKRKKDGLEIVQKSAEFFTKTYAANLPA